MANVLILFYGYMERVCLFLERGKQKELLVQEKGGSSQMVSMMILHLLILKVSMKELSKVILVCLGLIGCSHQAVRIKRLKFSLWSK